MMAYRDTERDYDDIPGTYVFDAYEDYTPKGYKELGSVPEGDHAAAMEAAGFEVQDA